MDSKAIYRALRRKIIHLELSPESVLNISELAEEFQVSRTPVKEVLIALQTEEWVVRQGAHLIVTPLSLERIREITEIRMVLEPQATIWAMQRITPGELDVLRDLERKALSMHVTDGNIAIVDMDFKIHHTIFQASRNIQLTTLLERLLNHYLRFWLAAPRQIKIPEFFAETRELIRALEHGDAARVRTLTVEHIRSSVAEIMGTR